MKDIQTLKKIAYRQIYSLGLKTFPLDVKKISREMNITLKSKELFPDEWNNQVKPFISSNAHSLFISGEKAHTLYYDMQNSYLIMREISLFILTESKVAITDKNIELLTLLQMAPPIILKELDINTVEEISKLCNTPAHITRKYLNYLLNADEPTAYDAEIKHNFKGYIKSYNHKSIADKIFDKAVEASTKLMEKGLDDPDPKLDNVRYEITEGYRISHIVYMDDQTHIYHEWDCPHIQDKIDISADCIANAEKKEYSPCPDCIRKLK